MSQPPTSQSKGWLLPILLVVGALASMILIGGGLLALWAGKPSLFDHPWLKAPPPTTTAAPVPLGPPVTTGGSPHPMYPTAEQAGTLELFDAQDADRGPHVDPSMTAPTPEPSKPKAYRVHCELDPGGLVCGPEQTQRPDVGWVIRDQDGKHVARLLRMGFVAETIVREMSGDRVRRILRFDGHGNVQAVRFFDEAGGVYTARKRTGENALEGCGRVRLERDARGRVNKATCLQWNGKPMKDKRGIVATEFVRDRHGFVTEERYFGADGKKVAGQDGVHRLEVERDASGRRVAERGYDVEGAAVLSESDGCHATQWRYDEAGLRTERRCLGVDGKLARDREEVAVVRYALDERGCEIGERYLDPAQEATPSYQGVHAVRRQVSLVCETEEKRCLDVQGGLLPCGPREPAVYRYRLDEAGQVEAVTHHSPHGAGTDPSFGVYELRYELDETGLRVEQTCFDVTGGRRECGSTGFHGRLTKYDAAGREIEARFFDVMRAPATNNGTHVRTFTYDAYDHLVETRNLDPRGRLVDSMGCAITRYLYDESHRLFAVLLQDAQGKPATYTGCFTGLTCPTRPWHAVRVVRSSKGRAIQNMFFDRHRSLVYTSDCDVGRCWE
ncbi:MAG: hypothetical protein ACOC1F_09375 [Myxococcota bacterium]